MEEFKLTRKQFDILNKLSELDISRLDCILENKSIIGRFFQWIDDNILSKTTRLWMYLLEMSGIFAIFIVLFEVKSGFELLYNSTTELEIQKAKLLLDSVTNAATPLATMIATICGGIPVVMGVFRSFNKKWKNNDQGN